MATVVTIVVALIGVVGAALSRQLADEFKAWTPWLIERLIERAVSRLSLDQQERFDEEWRSHINEIPGEIGKLVVALGLPSAARKMAPGANASSEQRFFAELPRRVLDLSFSSAFLIFCAPVLVFVCIAIRLETKGPILSLQRCVGRNGRIFLLCRLRIYEATAGEASLRKTAVGRFLFRLRIDHVPSLINVLRGEMSLIGPRPYRVCIVDERSWLFPYWQYRTKVKPGLIGWAAIQEDAFVDFRTELAHDLYYIKNRSAKLDLIIFCRAMLLIFLDKHIWQKEKER